MKKLTQDDLKVIWYEVSFVVDAQRNLITHAQAIIDEANAAVAKMDELQATLREKIPYPTDWTD